MTKEQIVGVLESELWIEGSGIGGRRIRNKEEAADRILSALESEREGEAVLGNGEFNVCLMAAKSFTGCRKFGGLKGVLVFREEK